MNARRIRLVLSLLLATSALACGNSDDTASPDASAGGAGEGAAGASAGASGAGASGAAGKGASGAGGSSSAGGSKPAGGSSGGPAGSNASGGNQAGTSSGGSNGGGSPSGGTSSGGSNQAGTSQAGTSSGGSNQAGASSGGSNSGGSSEAGSNSGGSPSGGTSSGGTSSGGTSSGGTNSGGSPGGGSGGGTNGNPDGKCEIPAEAQAEDISNPTTVVGDGTPASCTGDKVVAAVHAGGVVTFDCGAEPLTIIVPEIAIFNDAGPNKDGSVVIDGGGKITLSGGKANGILYQNTCDQNQHWTTPHCNAQDTPHLVVQNIAFVDAVGSASQDRLGGGAIFVAGGTFKAVNARFAGNSEPDLAQDYAGGAIYGINLTHPTHVVNSTFEGNSGCNGGALGGIGVSWNILNSVFSKNATLGHGQNPAQPGTPGGGLGGAIYADGNDYALTLCGTLLTDNTASDLGSGSIFQVVDNLNGDLNLTSCTFTGNTKDGGVQQGHPSIYVEARDKVGNAGIHLTSTTFD
jgi:hypothetical protein